MDPVRILLDTNVWRYVVAQEQVARLRSESRSRGWEVQVAPAVVYEVLRYQDDGVRQQVAEALTRTSWARLMPEIFTESHALVSAIRRRRPDWLRPDPDLRAFHQQRADWVGNGGFWLRARRDPAWQASLNDGVGDRTLDIARRGAELRRESFSKIAFEKLDTRWTTRVPGRPEGVDAWRVENALVWWHGLFGQEQQVYRDWCEPFLNLPAIAQDGASWERLWFDELDAAEMPGSWLRWAVGWFQATKKVTRGTPGDNQLASYLTDTDLLVSGDKGFLAVIEAARRDAPFAFAATVKVPAAGNAVDAIIAAVPA